MTEPTPLTSCDSGSTQTPGANLPWALGHAQDAVLPSSALLGERQAIEIEHNGQRYRLQSTRSGKLILTK